MSRKKEMWEKAAEEKVFYHRLSLTLKTRVPTKTPERPDERGIV